MKCHLVLLETAGNQRYVFATNRLRENIGASELLYRIGTAFVICAVAEKGGASYSKLADDIDKGRLPVPDVVREFYRIAQSNPGPLEKDGIEIVVATSGKAVLLVKEKETAKAIISQVTWKALEEAPGTVVRGVITEIDLAGSAGEAHEAVKHVHRGIEALRLDLPSPELRFPTLPILQPCRSSGLPAVGVREQNAFYDDEESTYEIAAPVQAKEQARWDGLWRMRNALGCIGERLPDNVDKLFEDQVDWLGVIHADGNGFGQLFLEFNEYLDPELTGALAYFDAYRQFSLSLELCGIEAFRKALEHLEKQQDRQREQKNGQTGRDEPAAGDGSRSRPKRDPLLVVPLVLGGDDLTVVCDGRQAVEFAARYLEEFEKATENPDLDGFKSNIPAIAEHAKTQLGAAAGVAIVKPHFPFHRAYDLAEDLTKSAKAAKRLLATKDRPCLSVSALDFQTVYENGAADLSLMREAWITRDTDGRPKEQIFARPYIISPVERINMAVNHAKDREHAEGWVRHRRFDGFLASVKALRRAGRSRAGDDSRGSGLPRSQQHALREALFRGSEAALARLSLIEHRYSDVRWDEIKRDGAFIFPDVRHNKGGWVSIRATVFLDALEFIDIVPAPADEAADDGEKGEAA